ncbi:MAG: SufE family protein [Gammaproteobacteria bacterium]
MTRLDDIVEVFELLGDWDQRYQYLIELGEALPHMPAEYKTEANKVKGCMSQVWVHAAVDETDPRKLHYQGDSDTSVIKGVLALLIQLLNGKSAQEIQQLDMDDVFERLDLHENLSPNRHVGIYAIVELMKQQARELDARLKATDAAAV